MALNFYNFVVEMAFIDSKCCEKCINLIFFFFWLPTYFGNRITPIFSYDTSKDKQLTLDSTSFEGFYKILLNLKIMRPRNWKKK